MIQSISFPDLKPGELAFLCDSGRAFRVQAFEVTDFTSDTARAMGLPKNGPPEFGDHYIAWRATQVDPTSGAPIMANDRPVEGPLEGRHIAGSLIASGKDSHQEHWRLFMRLTSPSINPEPPAGLVSGCSMQADGVTWYAGTGHPDVVLQESDGKLGDCYLNVQNGDIYKFRQGLIAWRCSVFAAEFDAQLTAVADRASLNLPTL